MKTILRITGSLLVGVAVFLGTLVAATELLAPHVWPALLVSGPIALVAGVFGLGITFLGLRYREEKAANGRASRRTIARLGGFVAGVGGFVLAGVAVTATLGTLAMPLFTSMLFGGLPAGTLLGLLSGFLVARSLGRGRGGDAGRDDAEGGEDDRETRSAT